MVFLETVCSVLCFFVFINNLPDRRPNFSSNFLNLCIIIHEISLTALQDEPTAGRGRRILHGGRSLGQVRARRTTNQNFGSSSSASTTTTPLFNHGSAAVRDTIDPIAKLLSQLSGVRRSAQQSQQSVQSQLQLLQQQLQFEREQVQQTRERLERLPRRPLNSSGVTSATPATRQDNSSTTNSGFLLAR